MRPESVYLLVALFTANRTLWEVHHTGESEAELVEKKFIEYKKGVWIPTPLGRRVAESMMKGGTKVQVTMEFEIGLFLEVADGAQLVRVPGDALPDQLQHFKNSLEEVNIDQDEGLRDMTGRTWSQTGPIKVKVIKSV